MMMASSPMAVLAADGEGTQPGTDGGTITAPTTEGVCDAAQTAASEAEKAVAKANGSAEVVKQDVVGNVKAGEAGSSETTEESKSTEEPKTTEETESKDLAQEGTLRAFMTFI